jgi:inactive STAND/Effector-associated domain 9
MSAEANRQNRINLINQRIANLSEELAAINNQLSYEKNDADRVKLKRQYKIAEDKLGQEEKELEGLEVGHSSYRQAWNTWEENLHEIDFDTAKKITSSLSSKYSNQEGVALFFMHNSQKMGGRWYMKFIKSQFQSLPLSSWAEPFEYRSDQHPGGDAQVFLSKLSDRFAPNKIFRNEQEQMNQIIDAIYQSLPRSHVFFISVAINQVRPQDVFLEWFVNQFWQKVVMKSLEVKNKPPLVRIIGVVSVQGKVDKNRMPINLCCSLKNFEPEKMLELKLQAWTKGQICKWLEAYSEIDPGDISNRAQSIREVTKGVPLSVYDILATEIHNGNSTSR